MLEPATAAVPSAGALLVSFLRSTRSVPLTPGPITSQAASSSAYQVENQNDDCDHDQNVNQTTADVQGETQEPQNHKNYEDCPKHIRSF
jgi:hypothetical protein